MFRYLSILSLLLTGCIDFTISDEKAREMLAENEVEPKFGDLQVQGRNMHYVFTDQSKEVLAIFVHGSPGSWNAFIDFFKADTLMQEMDLLSIDRPGFGKSGYGVAEPSMQRQAYFLNEVAKQFPHPTKILIGHSLGGPVIARLAMDYPDTYSGLVMVAPSIDPEMEEDEWYRDAINTRLGGLITPEDFEVSNDEILPLKEELTEMLPFWDRIRIPTIVVHGTKDSLVPVENAAFAEKMIIDSLLQVELLEGVDHFIPWSNPGEIVKAIRRLADGQQIYP